MFTFDLLYRKAVEDEKESEKPNIYRRLDWIQKEATCEEGSGSSE